MKYYKSKALLDPLTELYNKRAFDRFYRKEGEDIALALVDVDYFKQYNDTYGHEAGDNLLKTIGNILQEVAAEYDYIVYRVGGDEFAAIGFDKDQTTLRLFCQEVIDRMHQMQIGHSKSPYQIATVTIGASYRPHTKSRETLYRCVDRILYHAKKRGRNRYQIDFCDDCASID